MIVNFLKRHGLTVDDFPNAEVAFQHYLENDYDIILTDIVLGSEMSGIDLINHVRRLPGKKGDVPIVAITGFNDEARKIELFNLGVNDYIVKPFSNEELIARLKNHIFNRKAQVRKHNLSERIFCDAHESITITDTNNVIVDVNPAFCEITGYSREESVGQKISFIKSGKHGQDFYQAMWDGISKDGHWAGEIWNRKKSGELFAQWITITPLLSETGEVTHYVGLFSDITALKMHQKKLEKLALYDELTSLPNRTLLFDILKRETETAVDDGHMFALCYLDLDGFKEINNHFGRKAGDEFLVEISHELKRILDKKGLISRLFGDEFALLLTDFRNIDECKALIGKIIEEVRNEHCIEGKAVRLDVSVGVTVYPNDQSDSSALLRHAHQAMCKAKELKQSGFYFYNDIYNQDSRDLKDIEDSLMNNEFCLFYQPKVDIFSRKVVGVEALIRWQHPRMGIIPPIKFLPLISGTSFEPQFDRWVLIEAFKQLESWREQGIKMNSSINISPVYLQLPVFYEDVSRCLRQYPEIDSKQIEFEILESSAINTLDSIIYNIKKCIKELGVSFSLDDFGTGFSSLSHLRHLPISTVKIDQSFVRNMLDNAGDFSIVEGVIGLSKAFKRHVVAEGVETEAHVEALKRLNCNICQGYAFARPMPAEEITAWVKDFA